MNIVSIKVFLYIRNQFLFIQIAGVLQSDQARTTPIALPYKSVVSVAPKGYACRIANSTLKDIQQKIVDLVPDNLEYVLLNGVLHFLTPRPD